jgi:hypothetical protein
MFSILFLIGLDLLYLHFFAKVCNILCVFFVFFICILIFVWLFSILIRNKNVFDFNSH